MVLLETSEAFNFWGYFSCGADIISYISMVITIITLCTTVGIRKSLLAHIEKSDYLKDIDNKIKTLRSYEETIEKDTSLCNDALFDFISVQLDDILISYETILNKKIITQIKTLKTFVENNKGERMSENKKIECRKQLHAICTRLEKEKKLI